jgi:hypothetical protein
VGVDLKAVHVTRPLRGQSRHEGDVVHHNGRLPDEQIVHVDGLRVTRADRAVLDVARLAGFEPGVVTADAALHRGLVAPSELSTLAVELADWPGGRVVRRVVRFADRLSESVGESRTRVLFRVEGLPPPRLQVEIWTDGRLLGRVDLLDEESMTVVEFDGRMKYRLNGAKDPRSLEEVLWAEKRREDDIRARGYGFARVAWHDLDQPGRTASRLRATFSQRRSARGLWLPARGKPA